MSTDKPVRCALYGRVSTKGQKTVPEQFDELRAYAARRGWTVVQEVADIRSGAKDRPNRRALMDAARSRQIDVIAVWKLDRWGRSMLDLVATLHELTELGVGFASVSEGIDLTTAAGRLLAAVLSAFAAFERDAIIERTHLGLNHARKHGTRSGRPIGRPAIAASRSVEVRALRHQKFSLKKIAAKTGLSYGSVQRLLAEPPEPK
jgi:DNA invertase Pin-like site-specific DNA recombinase